MESVNFNHLYYFHIVAEQGSVTGAAKVANVTKPTISAQLRQLEEFLGAELFDRRGGRMRLSDAGRVAFRHTEVMFDAGRTLMRHFRHEDSEPPQTLRVGVGSETSRAIAADFFQPLLDLEGVFLRIQHEDGASLQESLLSLEIDLMIVHAEPPDYESLGLGTRLLERSPLVAVVASDQAGPGDDLAALLDKRRMLHHWKHTHLHWRIEEWLTERNLRPRVEAHIDDVPTMLAMVRRGDAVAIVPRTAAAEPVRDGEIRVVGELDGLEADTYAVFVQRDVPRIVEEAVGRLCRVAA